MRAISRLVALPAVLVVGLAAYLTQAASSQAAGSESFAVIGDTPYTATERNQFPNLVRAINADAGVSMVLHVGDVKSGESLCNNAVYQDRVALFDTFADPFVITPGDNEWTDCQRVAAGQYVPTERLDYLRRTFYAQPGVTLGQNPTTVATQASNPSYSEFRENVRFERAGVVFATVHVVGSRNGRAPWNDLPGGDQPAVRTAEYKARDAANVAWIDAAFNRAEATGAAGVLLLMQAEPKATSPFIAVRSKIVARARAFNGEVLLVHGDEHRYEVETSYAGVPNLTRLETFKTGTTRWLKLTVDPGTSAVFSWVTRNVP